MYIPSSFEVNEFDQLAEVIEEYGFAALITHDRGSPFASHLPVLFHPQDGPSGTLFGHMARANPQWRHFANGEEVLILFGGPHAYISPSWYETGPAVPTWNYVAVHAYGVPEVIESETELEAVVQELVQKYESHRSNPWKGDLPGDYKARMLKAIVGFKVPVSRIEGKFKLGQNRPLEDREGVYQALSQSPSENDQKLAEYTAGGMNGKS